MFQIIGEFVFLDDEKATQVDALNWTGKEIDSFRQMIFLADMAAVTTIQVESIISMQSARDVSSRIR